MKDVLRTCLLALALVGAYGTTAAADEPSPSPAPPPAPTLSPEQLESARSTIAATSLLERLSAQAARVEAERRYLGERLAAARTEREAIDRTLVELRAREQARREAHARVLQQAYRQSHVSTIEVLLESRSIVEAVKHSASYAAIGAQEQSLLAEIRAVVAGQTTARDELAAREAEIERVSGSLEAKEAALSRLVARTQRLRDAAAAGASVSRVELEIVGELAAEVARAHEDADRILSDIAQRSGITLPQLGEFVWPTRGVVSQEFGPSGLTLEPPATYGGVAYPHFHDGIDIAAPLGTPVLAVARGRVAFAGHLSDGAMVVIVQHEGGLVTLYGHLDDAAFAPSVRVGQTVEAGDALGAIGMTGITTGPHLHFSARRAGEPVDPRALLPAR